MKNPFKQLFRARDEPKPTDAVSAAQVFYFGSSASGKPVNARTAIHIQYSLSPTYEFHSESTSQNQPLILISIKSPSA